MKPKKIVVLLIIVVALGGGLYLFQKNKQETELIAHNKLKFQRMTTAAKKNRYTGLIVMASTINKYHKIKGHYPKTLLDLYPEFIPDKLFILTLNWKYYPENKSYLIKRNLKNQIIFASMGPDLKLKTGRDDSVTQSEKVALKDFETIKKISLSNIKIIKRDVKIEEKRNNTLHKPSVRIVKKELDKNEEFLLSFNGSRLYIWKTKDGIIGFSDVQYPEKKQLTIYRNQNWIEYSTN